MAVPTISSVSPIAGHTGGRQFLELEGTNFRVPTTPVYNAATGITAPSPPSVAVMFGTTPAREVRWLSPTLLYVITPIHDPGAVAVSVQNIDDTGAPIPGELATLPCGYTFLLPVLTADEESDLARCARAFLQELKRQVTPNTVYPRNTDYSDEEHALHAEAVLPKMPGLVVVDFTLKENDFYSRRGPEDVEAEGGNFVALEPPVTVDLVFTLCGLSTSRVELFNLFAAVKAFFRKNPYLTMARDPSDAELGTVQYEMQCREDRESKFAITSNKDNVEHFIMVATVIGFDIEGIPGIPTGTSLADQSEGVRDYGPTVEPGGVSLLPTGVRPGVFKLNR